MKKIMKLGILTSFAALTIAAANAQTNANVVLTVNFALTGFEQNGNDAKAVRVSNKEIINSLNASSNGFAFGRSSKIVIVSTISDQVGAPVFQIRERSGGTSNVTDITTTGNLSLSEDPTQVVARNGTVYTIVTFTFSDGAGNDFTVSGFATLRNGRVSGRGVGTIQNVTTGAAVQVSGTGHVNGNPAVFKGTVSAGGPKAEAAD